jgi:DHA2 family multidrug resistance protein
LSRTIGSSIGISVVGTLLSRETQANWNRLGGHINVYNPALGHWLHANGLSLNNPLTPRLLGGELSRHAMMVAFIDCFWVITWSMIILAPLVLILRRAKGGSHVPSPPLH